VSGGGAGTGGRDQGSGIFVLCHREERGVSVQDNVCGVGAIQVRGHGARAMDAIGPTLLAERGLPQHHAMVALATGDASFPEQPLPRGNAAAVYVAALARDVHDASHPLVPEDDGQGRAWVIPAPHVHVRAAHASGLDRHQHLPRLEPGHLERLRHQKLAKGTQYRRRCLHAAGLLVPWPPAT